MRRRVIRIGDDCYRVELPGGDISKFAYQSREECYVGDKTVDPDLEQHLLFWEDAFMDSFAVKEDVLMFILRFGYSIADYHLIPSEILADFGLVYTTGVWVDSWNLAEWREVRPVSSNVARILRPANRLIHFSDYTPNCHATRNRLTDPYFDEKGILQLEASKEHRTRRREIVADIKIPKLDFEKLEKPKRRIRRISLSWRDRSQFAFGGFGRRESDAPDLTPDEECVFTLKSGNCAENDPTT